MATYYDSFSCYADVKGVYDQCPPEDRLVYAGYTYSGSALVVFIENGRLYENNDGHCSCNGLEIWSPEPTLAQALLQRQGWPDLHTAVLAAVVECFDAPAVHQLRVDAALEEMRSPRAITLRH